MTERQQNENWERLTPDFRKEIKRMFSLKVYNDFSSGYNQALILLFGKHNLTSDTEPEEMLMVKRKKVQEEWKYIAERNYAAFGLAPLQRLFGDKCLSEKEPSVKVEPKYKFSLGQKVIMNFHGGEKGTISERLPPQDGIVWNCYKVKELPYHLWRENELEPYTEQETNNENKGNVVVCRENIMYFGCPAKICNGFKHNILKDGDIVTVISYNRDKDTYDVVLNSIIGETIHAKNLEPYTEETNDETMQDFEQETRSKVEESRKEYIKSQAEREAKTMFDRQLLEEIYVMLKNKL